HRSSPDENATDLLLGRLRTHPSVPIFELAQEGGGYRPMRTADFVEDVKAVAKGLIASEVAPGDVAAIPPRTRYEWALADWAIWWAGGVSVPIYESSSPSQIQWIASDSAAKFALVESTRHKEDMESVRGELPALQRIGVLEDGILEDLRERGAGISDEELESRRTARRLDDVATIIYTSGTTGRPKGAELTHANFVDTTRSAVTLLGEKVLPSGSRLLMFLPLAHVFARLITVLAAAWPVTTAFTPD